MHQSVQLVKEEELLRLLLAGYMIKECAAQLRCRPETARKYARQPHFLARLKELSHEMYERVDSELKASKDDILTKLEEYSAEALDEMMDLARAEKGIVKLKALQDVMDRNPQISRTKRIEGTTDHNFVSPLFLVHAANTARELERAVKVDPPDQLKEGERPDLPHD